MWLAFIEMIEGNSFSTNFIFFLMLFNTAMILFLLKFNKIYVVRNIDVFEKFYYGTKGLLKKETAVTASYIFLLTYYSERILSFFTRKKTFPYLNDNKTPRAHFFPNVTQESILEFKKKYIWIRVNLYIYRLNLFTAIVFLTYCFIYLY